MRNICISIVSELKVVDNNDLIKRPGLVIINEKNIKIVKEYFFPRNNIELQKIKSLYKFENEFNHNIKFDLNCRFGFTGIKLYKKIIYCSYSNLIYKIDSKTFKVISIISNHLMEDLHSIDIKNNKIYFVNNVLNLVVVCDLQGKIIVSKKIHNDLKISSFKTKEDRRYIKKIRRGPQGSFHFNYTQIIKDKIFLTSRSTNSIIKIDLNFKKATLCTFQIIKPSLIHDGLMVSNKIYLSSINGLIKIYKHNFKDSKTSLEKIIDLNDYKDIKKILWCRGLLLDGDTLYVGINGYKYNNTYKNFELISLNSSSYNFIKTIKSEKFIDSSKYRYMSIFQIIKV